MGVLVQIRIYFDRAVSKWTSCKWTKSTKERASQRLQNNDTGDDGLGGRPLLMAYVNDTNCLLPLADVLFSLQPFAFASGNVILLVRRISIDILPAR
jgi:hypothetical protein